MFAAQQKVGFSGTFTQQVAMRAWAEISSQQEGVEVFEKLGRSNIIFWGMWGKTICPNQKTRK